MFSFILLTILWHCWIVGVVGSEAELPEIYETIILPADDSDRVV
jgi:hypothetical protein